MAERIEAACTWVRRGLRRRRQNIRRPMEGLVHPVPMKRDWVDTWIADSPREVLSPPQGLDRLPLRSQAAWATQSRWTKRWRQRPPAWGETRARPPDRKILELHQGLHKSQSSVLVQLRSGKTGLAAFLCKRKVPGFDTPVCQCGYHAETVLHVLVHCPRLAQQRQALLHEGRLNKGWLLDTPQGAQLVTKWWIQQGILPQFSLAQQLMIYGPCS